MASVNVPTNQAQKERDINTKLQFYGIYSAFANGKVPSNKQIDVALNSFLASRAMSKSSNRLSREGQNLVADVRKVIQETKMLLLTKNEGNLIQEFVWDAQNIDGANAATPHAPIDKATAQQHGDQALDGLKTLGRLILSNGQFRKLLSDATVLLRDIAGDAAQTAASKVNPDQERLKQIDQPAEDNTWHDVPDMNAQSLKQQARETFDRNKPFSAGEAKQAIQDGINTAQNHPSQDNRQAGKAGISRAVENLQSKAQQNVPDEQQDRARNMKDTAVQKTKNYMNEKIPQERREQTIYRLKKMIVEIQGHSDYQQAIDTLLNLAETYAGHTKSVTKQTVGTVQEAHADTNLQRVERNLKTLIERFANFTSTDDLFEAINALYRDADRDPELKNWFKRLDRYVRKCLKEQGYILRDEATREWNELYDQGDYLLRERYRDHSNHLVDEIKFLSQEFDNDPQNHAFASAVTKLFLDLGRDENGQPTFKTHLIKDLTEVIVPAIFENTRYVPIPRIEVSDPMVDLVVENLVIESDNLFPNSLEFSTDNYWRYGRKSISNHRDNRIMIAASGIQMDLRDVAYYVHKKQGFPSITDKGVMDIILAGEGFSFKIAARNAQKTDRSHFVAIDKVDVVIKNLAIKIKQSNHKLLFTIAKSLVLKLMRPAIQKAIEKQIKDNFMKADAFAYSIHQEVQRGAQYAKEHPDEAGNIYQRYVQAFQTKINEKKAKAQDKSKNTDVNLAMTKEDSMFKNISLPGGISTKATEYRELARKGQRWESPVFSIGSAGSTSNLPRAQTVQRKPHSTRSPGVRGGNQPSGATSGSGLGTSSVIGGAGSSSYQPGNTVSSSSTGYATGYDTGSGNYSSGNYGIGSTGPTSAVGGSGYGTTMPTSTLGTAGYGPSGGYGSSGQSATIGGTGYDGASYGTGLPSSATGTGNYGTTMPSSTTGTGSYGTTHHTIGGPTGVSGVAPGSVGVASSGFNQEVDQAFRGTGTSGLSSGATGVTPNTGLGSTGVAGVTDSSAANTSLYDSATVDRR